MPPSERMNCRKPPAGINKSSPALGGACWIGLLCREMDSDTLRPLLFPYRVLYGFQSLERTSGFPAIANQLQAYILNHQHP